jgi:hypothetical protein
MTAPPAAPTSAAPLASSGTLALLIALLAGFAPFVEREAVVGLVALDLPPDDFAFALAGVERERVWDFCESPPRLGAALLLVLV